MFTINSISGSMVNVTFDGDGDPNNATRKNTGNAALYPKTLNLAGAPIGDDAEALKQFCSDAERSYYASWTMTDAAQPEGIAAIIGKKQTTLPPEPSPELEPEPEA